MRGLCMTCTDQPWWGLKGLGFLEWSEVSALFGHTEAISKENRVTRSNKAPIPRILGFLQCTDKMRGMHRVYSKAASILGRGSRGAVAQCWCLVRSLPSPAWVAAGVVTAHCCCRETCLKWLLFTCTPRISTV